MIDSNVLLNEARCLGCGSLSEGQMIIAALLQRIAEAGGGGGGSPAAPDMSVQFNDAGAFGGDADLTFNDATNVLALTGTLDVFTGSIAASSPAIEMTQTWNNAGVTFTAIDLNITDTASAATSLLMALRVGGTSQVTVQKDGAFTTVASVSVGAASFFRFVGRSTLSSAVNGNLLIANAAFGDFGLLQFGGTAATFPALKRSATILQTRLANDSAYAPFEANTLRTATAYTVGTLPAAGLAGRRAYVTDATAPTYNGALVGGGAVVVPVFDTGAAWVSA